LSEQDFGKAGSKDSARERLENIYRPVLGKNIDAEFLEPEFYINNYQILRNFYYIEPNTADRLFFIFPKANKSLFSKADVIARIAARSLSNQVRILFLEDCIDRILGLKDLDGFMRAHYKEFKRKYVI